MRIKICGIRRMEDVEILNRYKPDYAGFVFAESKRKVSPEQAQRLRSALNPDIRTVGVFVNEKPETIINLADKGVIDMIQLHGDEDETDILLLKQWTEKPVIKAVRVKSPEYVEEMQRLPCDYLLLDTYEADHYGGTGRMFDLNLLPPLSKPYFLAGGLSPGNVRERLTGLSNPPFGVDVSSGVETEGYKDENKITDFLREVRQWK
ncbi:phosphoribosylanthranilate isomerase [Blautia schinkii]|nr:phosphoribosylanthranilate isomerase [Blautia schinkii]